MKPQAPLYEYVPLTADGSTFRVVSIWPGNKGDAILCEFLEVPTSAQPTYTALSYTWGDPVASNYVLHHGRAIAITSNLHHAIIRLRDANLVSTFWIDALCIDQQANSVEKGTQIPLMRHIYQNAAGVAIYLGPEADGSERIPTLCKKIEKAFARTSKDKRDVTESILNYDQSVINFSEYKELGLPEQNDPEWTILCHLLERA